MPERIQMSRQHPWRANHPDAVICARPSKWGNPYRIGAISFLIHEGGPVEQVIEDRAHAVLAFRTGLTARLGNRVPPRLGMDDYPIQDLHELRGRDLACWCPLGEPCHCDVLI